MKRIISVLLAVILVASCAVVSVSAYSLSDPDVQTVQEAVEEYKTYAEEPFETKRYYFLMPDGKNGLKGQGREDDNGNLVGVGEFAPTWYNEFVTGAGIYWWGTNKIDPAAWVGYAAMKSETPNVYYADVPAFVTGIVWNNGVDGGEDKTAPIFTKAALSADIGCQWYDPGESPVHPDGIPEEVGFGGMIWVVNPDLVSVNDYSKKQTCGGEWYYYYGEDCFGIVKDGKDDLAANCLNEAHDHNMLLGDVDMDGQVTVLDATEIQRYKAEIITELKCPEAAADVDREGKVSVMDATEIQLFIAELKTSDIIGQMLYTPVSTEPPTEEPPTEEPPTEDPSKKCERCGDTYPYPRSYGNYKQLCYDCYDTLTSKCHYCGDQTSSHVQCYYDNYRVCEKCYNILTSKIRCDICNEKIINPMTYNGYELCGDCYHLMKYGVKCDWCNETVSSYLYVENSGYTSKVCYPCWEEYERRY